MKGGGEFSNKFIFPTAKKRICQLGKCSTTFQNVCYLYVDPSATIQSEMLRGTGVQVGNIDTSIPQVHDFEDAGINTGDPFAELNATPSNLNVDHAVPRVLLNMPKITNTFSLAGKAACVERSQGSSKTEYAEHSSTSSGDVEVIETLTADNHSDWSEPHTDDVSQSACSEDAETCSTSSSEVEIVEPWELKESLDLSQSPCDEAKNIEGESSFLEFVLTEGSSLDAFSKCDIVALVLAKHKEKIRELEESTPQLEDMLTESETSIVQKTARLNLLQKEVDSLKKEIAEKTKSRNELRQKIELMNEEKNSLKRRVEHCQETKDLLAIPSKKARV